MTNVNNLLNGFNGGDSKYSHKPSQLYYTCGVQHLAKQFGCYWLIDAIVSHQLSDKVRAEEFQVWVLKRIQNYTFMLTCSDGNGNLITDQFIEFSDFTGDEVKLYFTNNTLLLPSEN